MASKRTHGQWCPCVRVAPTHSSGEDGDHDYFEGDLTDTVGHVSVRGSLAAFNPGDIGAQVHCFIDTVTSAPIAPGRSKVLYPGQRSQELRRARVEQGTVEVPRPQAEALVELGDSLGIDAPPSVATVRRP
jgi:LDH2 family malate/lactate/ureidoglycolate dehydrogenase